LEINHYNFNAKDKILVVAHMCNYKLCNHLGQVAKDNWSQKKLHVCIVTPIVTYHLKLQGFFIHGLVISVATPLWGKCEVATHTPKNGIWKSSRIFENSEHNCKGQNTSHWGVLYTVGKFLKCKCPKWPRMSHLDICSTNYIWKKGQESNWQFDSRPLKIKNRPNPNVCRWSATHHWKALKENYKFSLDLVPIRRRSEKLCNYTLLMNKPNFLESNVLIPKRTIVRKFPTSHTFDWPLSINTLTWCWYSSFCATIVNHYNANLWCLWVS